MILLCEYSSTLPLGSSVFWLLDRLLCSAEGEFKSSDYSDIEFCLSSEFLEDICYIRPEGIHRWLFCATFLKLCRIDIALGLIECNSLDKYKANHRKES